VLPGEVQYPRGVPFWRAAFSIVLNVTYEKAHITIIRSRTAQYRPQWLCNLALNGVKIASQQQGIPLMGTHAVLMSLVAVATVLLPLVVITHMARRIVHHRKGQASEEEGKSEPSRVLIVTGTTVVMLLTIMFLGPDTLGNGISMRP
jgi:hypothetical protein